MKIVKQTLFALLVVVVLAGCTDHRTLHVESKPMFVLKNDWSVSRVSPESATAMFFSRTEPYEPMYNNPHRHKLYLDSNKYDILVFNEIMFSPSVSNLDGIIYRGTESFNTFGAYSKPSPVNPIFRVDPDEVMVGYGYPETLATGTSEQKEILSIKDYLIKYLDGKNQNPEYEDYEADSVELIPIRVTREVKIVAHVKNLRSQFRVSGVLRGFTEGVLLSTRQPNGANAAYTFNLNSAIPDPEVEGGHIIVSTPFLTFGPWWNDYPSDRKYILDIVAAKDNGGYRYSLDVTQMNLPTVSQGVAEAIVKIQEEETQFLIDGIHPKMEQIIIEIWFDLPQDPSGGGDIDVGVGDWGTDIIIPIPIR